MFHGLNQDNTIFQMYIWHKNVQSFFFQKFHSTMVRLRIPDFAITVIIWKLATIFLLVSLWPQNWQYNQMRNLIPVSTAFSPSSRIATKYFWCSFCLPLVFLYFRTRLTIFSPFHHRCHVGHSQQGCYQANFSMREQNNSGILEIT